MSGWDGEPGTDYFGYPPCVAPNYLSPVCQKIFAYIQDEMIGQAKANFYRRNGHGYVMIRKDLYGTLVVETEINLIRLAEGIEKILEEEEEHGQLALDQGK